MAKDQITALAREFAEETRNGILGLFPQPLPDSMEVLIKNDQEYYGRFLRWLTRRYCLVEKSKVKDIHKGIPLPRNRKGGEMKCNKRKYKDKISAMFALSQCHSQNAIGNRQERRVYLCPICGKWHLTSQTKK